LAYQGYGKRLIKKYGLSPDAYVQMSIQLAYFKLFGHSRATYESAQVKKYAFGRTETCRSVSEDTVAWCQVMTDYAHPNHGDAGKKLELFKKAALSQNRYMTWSVDGRGVDRHLLGGSR
jgi:carnitine O-acetyltransferase